MPFLWYKNSLTIYYIRIFSMTQTTLAVIGGSGLYDIEGLTNIESHKVTTPFGEPSDDIISGELNGVKMFFLPRHGKGHLLLPSEINFRANIYALKKLGAQMVLSISAVGSMKDEYAPGDVVLVDQFFDQTKKRINTFFGSGIVGHIEFAHPVCLNFGEVVSDGVKDTVSEGHDKKVHKGGTYICIEGPQFSTKAESNIYRSWGVDVIGMTNLPEARLAREAELCYATMAMVTDFDCWHETEESVTVEKILEVLRGNVDFAKAAIENIARKVSSHDRACHCDEALKYAVITDKARISGKVKENLDLLIGKYL